MLFCLPGLVLVGQSMKLQGLIPAKVRGFFCVLAHQCKRYWLLAPILS